jgi:hypothetical protein
MDLQAISDVVRSDSGLMARMVGLLRESSATTSTFPSVEECIVELGERGLRQLLCNARLIQASTNAEQN